MNATPCTVCGEGGHRMNKCPTLSAPLRPGFYSPAGGHQHSEGDDDEKLVVKFERPVPPVVVKSPKCLTQSKL